MIVMAFIHHKRIVTEGVLHKYTDTLLRGTSLGEGIAHSIYSSASEQSQTVPCLDYVAWLHEHTFYPCL